MQIVRRILVILLILLIILLAGGYFLVYAIDDDHRPYMDYIIKYSDQYDLDPISNGSCKS